MDTFVARANIDHYLGLLDGSDLSQTKRTTITKLLIAEEEALSHDLEQLEFAEDRLVKCIRRGKPPDQAARRLCRWLDGSRTS